MDTSEYKQKFRETYGFIEINSPLQVSLPLDKDIMPRVYLWDNIEFRNIYSFASRLKAEPKRFQVNLEIDDGIKVVTSSSSNFIVLGSSGMGKSSFLKRLGLEILKQNHNALPIYIDLNFIQFDTNPFNSVFNYLAYSGHQIDRELFCQLFKAGKLFFLLDRLDSLRDDGFMNFLNSVAVKSKNRLVFSTQFIPSNYRKNFKNFSIMELVGFDDNQIEIFANNWFNSGCNARFSYQKLENPDDIAKDLMNSTYRVARFLKALNLPRNLVLKKSASVPLLLSDLCLLFDLKEIIPVTNYNLYQSLLDFSLLNSLRYLRKELREYLHRDLLKLILYSLAYENFLADKSFFSKEYLVEKIETFLINSVNIFGNDKISGEDILSIFVSSNLLIEIDLGKYSFQHHYWQCFLVACHLLDDDVRLTKFIKRSFNKKNSEHIFLFIFEVKNNSYFLELLENSAKSFLLSSPNLKYLFHWLTTFKFPAIPNSSNQKKLVNNITLFEKRLISLNHIILFFCFNNYQSSTSYPFRYLVANYSELHPYILAGIFSHGNITEQTFTLAFGYAIGNIFNNLVDDLIERIHFFRDYHFFDTNYSDLVNSLRSFKKKTQINYDLNTLDNLIQLANDLIHFWFSSFNFSFDKFSFSKEELQSLDSYLSIISLIFEIKERSIFFSKNDWKTLEKMMLTSFNLSFLKKKKKKY